MLCASTPATHDVDALLAIIGLRPWIGVDKLSFQGSVDEDGELASGGCDRLGLPDAERQATIKGAERRLSPP